MGNLHRIQWIDSQLRDRKYPNAVTLAEKFGISSRQASRDLEYMKDSLCAPLAYSHSHKGFYYDEHAFSVSNVMMTDGQRKALAYLAEQYKRMENEHATHLSRLLSKLIGESGANVDSFELPIFPVDPHTLSNFDALNMAIVEHRKIEARLSGHSGNEAVLLSPYKLYVFRKENYVVGNCEPMNEIRFFNLRELDFLQVRQDKYDLSPLLKQADIVPYLVNEANVAIIRFDIPSWAKQLKLRVRREEGDLLDIEYYDTEKLVGALLTAPCRIEVVSPGWLRNLIANRVNRAVRNLL